MEDRNKWNVWLASDELWNKVFVVIVKKGTELSCASICPCPVLISRFQRSMQLRKPMSASIKKSKTKSMVEDHNWLESSLSADQIYVVDTPSCQFTNKLQRLFLASKNLNATGEGIAWNESIPRKNSAVGPPREILFSAKTWHQNSLLQMRIAHS